MVTMARLKPFSGPLDVMTTGTPILKNLISKILDIKFFKIGVPVVITSKGPEKGFNRAIVTIRYQLAILPSTKLVTRLVEQEWVLEGEQWVVIPDLSTLLE